MDFKLNSDYAAHRRPAAGDRGAGAVAAGGQPVPDPARGDGLGQDVHDGQRHRARASGRSWSSRHNKTLAAQLYSEFKSFFPENAVEYFVSYYDYYQPEAYIPSSDTYIEKDSSINEEIERLRISATSSLVSRRDVIVVASVSCIYGLGSPEDFTELRIELRRGSAAGPQRAARAAGRQHLRAQRLRAEARPLPRARRRGRRDAGLHGARPARGVLRRRGRGASASSTR